MNKLNSTFDQSDSSVHQPRSGEMSVDGSLIDKESPPPYVTFRKGIPEKNMPDLRVEFQSFQNNMLAMLESWFTKHDEKLSKFLNDFEDIKTSITFISDKYDDLYKKTEDVSKRVASLEHKLNLSQPSGSRITELEAKLDDMEQRARFCNAEVSNLPEKRGENLVSILDNIATTINHPVTKQDIVSIHRVPQVNPKNPRPKNIIIKFSSQMLRDNFISATRLAKGFTTEQLKMAGPPQKVYINEHLTVKNKNLFRQTREASKQYGYRFVWIKHGTILVRANDTSPVIAVRTEEDLSRIIPIATQN